MPKLNYSATENASIPFIPGRKKGVSSLAPMELAKVLVATHARYDEFMLRWDKFLNCYQGSSMHLYLCKHTRESAQSLRSRLLRAYYLNYCEPVVDLYIHYIFSKPTIRKVDAEAELSTETIGDESLDVNEQDNTVQPSKETTGDTATDNLEQPEKTEWEEWLEDVDRQKNSIDRFMSKVGKFAFALGHVYVLVDMPKTNQEIRSEQERKDGKIQPYVSLYFPQDMVNFALDDCGELLWCRFKEQAPQNEDPFSLPDKRVTRFAEDRSARLAQQNNRPVQNLSLQSILEGEKEAYYKTWTRTQWFLHKITPNGAELVSSGKHPCGVVPVIPVYHSRHAKFPFFGHALLTDIADINCAIYNWSSLVDEEIYQKCLNVLCIQRTGQGGQSGDSEELVVGSNNALEYDGVNAPFYLSPATDPGSFIQSQIDRMRDEIFRIAKLGGGLGIETDAQKSGVSHAFEFNETNRTVAEKADELERAENRIHDYWYRWIGQKWNGVVDYPDNFSVESFDVELNLVLQSRQAISSPTFIKELQKRAVRKMLHNVEDDVIAIIEQEIMDAPEEASPGMSQNNQTIPPEQLDQNTQDQNQKPTETPSGS